MKVLRVDDMYNEEKEALKKELKVISNLPLPFVVPVHMVDTSLKDYGTNEERFNTNYFKLLTAWVEGGKRLD